MSGDTEQPPSIWTFESLFKYTDIRIHGLAISVDRRFAAIQLQSAEASVAQKEAVAAALNAAEKAVLKAEGAAEKRFDATNEFRQQLGDQAREFMPRREAEQLIEAVRVLVNAEHERVNLLDRRQGEIIAGRLGGDKVLAYVVGLAGVAVGLILRFA